MSKKSKANKRYRRNRGLKTFKYSSIYQKRKTRNHKYKNKNVRTMKKIYGGDDDFLSRVNLAEIQDNKKKARAAEKAAQAAEKMAKDEAQAAAAVKIQKKVRRLLTKRAKAKAKEAEVKAQEQEYEQKFGTSSNTQPKKDNLTKIYRGAFPKLGYDQQQQIVTQRNIVTQRTRTAKAYRSQNSMRGNK
jgi:hypothetical protein